MKRRAARRDANHAQIVVALRALGVFVIDTASAGDGIPDLICVWRGRVELVEVKDGDKSPSRRKLTPAQILLHSEVAQRGAKVHVVENVAQAIAVLGARVGA